VALGLGALALVGGATVYRGLVPVPRALAPLGVPFALLALALIWRDSAPLFALNLGGIALLAALASPRVRAAGRRRSGAGDYVRGGLQVAGGAAAGAWPLLLAEIDWRSLPDGGPAQRVRGALVGLVAAAPVAALFGSLLMEADPVFGHLMTAALGSGLDPLLGHGASILFWGWVAAGTLRLLLLRAADRRDEVSPPSGRFSLMEVGTVLLVVDLLFLAFVAVQFRYLFGGAELVRGLTGLGYAEYAREGFFQLVTVAALSLPLLLGADRALGRRDPGCSGASAGSPRSCWCLNVILASALWRMHSIPRAADRACASTPRHSWAGWSCPAGSGPPSARRTDRFGFARRSRRVLRARHPEPGESGRAHRLGPIWRGPAGAGRWIRSTCGTLTRIALPTIRAATCRRCRWPTTGSGPGMPRALARPSWHGGRGQEHRASPGRGAWDGLPPIA
jgi:hypothetical protein